MPPNTTNIHSSRDDYIDAMTRDYPHNYRVFILFDLIWGLGTPFARTLVPAFMVVLGSPKSLIGLVVSLPMMAAVIQVLTSYYFRHHVKRKWLSYSYFAALIPWMTFNLFFFANPQLGSNGLRLGLFCCVQAVFWLMSSGNEGIRFSMLTECTPLNKRGSLFGSRVAIQVIVFLMIWPLANGVLKRWPEPRNFLASFAVACFFYMASSFAYLLTREHRNPDIDNGNPQYGLAQVVSECSAILRSFWLDRNYRFFLFNSMVLYSITAMGTFIVVYGKEKMGLSGSKIISFTFIQMLGGALATKTLGKLADKVGYKKVGWMMTIPLALGFLIMAILAGSSTVHRAAVWGGFFLCASMISVARMVTMNMAIELRPRQNIGMLMSLTNALISPVALVVATFAGWMIDVTGTYVPLFLTGAVGAIAVGLGFAYGVQEPRRQNS